MQTTIKVRTRKKGFASRGIKTKYNVAVAKALKKIARKGKENIRNEIKKRDLVSSGTMLNSVTATPTKTGIKFKVGPDYAKYVDSGVKKHRMTYLTKSKVPVPVDVANRIFRWASPKAMREGKFVHPGFKRGKGFIKVALKRTREDASEALRVIARKIF